LTETLLHLRHGASVLQELLNSVHMAHVFVCHDEAASYLM